MRNIRYYQIVFNITLIYIINRNYSRFAKNKTEEEIIVDKNYVEAIQLKVKENICSKRSFKEKKVLGRIKRLMKD